LSDTAKLFINGRSQAVRLPAAYRFEGTEVYVRRDEETGDVILSSKPNNWDEFLEALKDLEVPDDFLSPAERVPVSSPKDPFEGWIE
jgi:antitoxin VapB